MKLPFSESTVSMSPKEELAVGVNKFVNDVDSDERNSDERNVSADMAIPFWDDVTSPTTNSLELDLLLVVTYKNKSCTNVEIISAQNFCEKKKSTQTSYVPVSCSTRYPLMKVACDPGSIPTSGNRF